MMIPKISDYTHYLFLLITYLTNECTKILAKLVKHRFTEILKLHY